MFLCQTCFLLSSFLHQISQSVVSDDTTSLANFDSHPTQKLPNQVFLSNTSSCKPAKSVELNLILPDCHATLAHMLEVTLLLIHSFFWKVLPIELPNKICKGKRIRPTMAQSYSLPPHKCISM
ncbi:unnamed protein product [Brassica oleracea var. botrytis]